MGEMEVSGGIRKTGYILGLKTALCSLVLAVPSLRHPQKKRPDDRATAPTWGQEVHGKHETWSGPFAPLPIGFTHMDACFRSRWEAAADISRPLPRRRSAQHQTDLRSVASYYTGTPSQYAGSFNQVRRCLEACALAHGMRNDMWCRHLIVACRCGPTICKELHRQTPAGV